MKQFLTYKVAQKLCRENKISKSSEYKRFRIKHEKKVTKFTSLKRRRILPSEPQVTWEKQWKGYYELLGTKHHRIRFMLSIDEAKKMNKKLKVKNRIDYIGKRLESMPAAPSSYYRKQKVWKGWGDYLGLDIVSSKMKVFVSYAECKKYVYENKIKSLRELREWSKAGKKPSNIPCNPEKAYRSIGWDGSKKFFSKEWLSYEEARELLRPYNLKGSEEFRIFIHNNPELNIPISPVRIYSEGERRSK